MKDMEESNETKTPVIGKFKTNKKLLNFLTVIGGNTRITQSKASIDGSKLSGMLEGFKFELEICDDNTVNMTQVEKPLNATDCDDAMLQRLVFDIESGSLTGYGKKFVIQGLTFFDPEGTKCHLEIDNTKPIDKLRALSSKSKVEVSSNASSVLKRLLGDKKPKSKIVEETEEIISEEIKTDETPNTFVNIAEESFKKMNEEKIVELRDRINKKEIEISKLNSSIRNNESILKNNKEDLRVLNTRLESLLPFEDPNGFVFNVSEEIKSEIGLDENSIDIISKISKIMNLKKDVLVKELTEGYFIINISDENDFENKKSEELNKALEKLRINEGVSMISNGVFKYSGDLNWHQLVDTFIKSGFKQSSDYDNHLAELKKAEEFKLDQIENSEVINIDSTTSENDSEL